MLGIGETVVEHQVGWPPCAHWQVKSTCVFKLPHKASKSKPNSKPILKMDGLGLQTLT